MLNDSAIFSAADDNKNGSMVNPERGLAMFLNAKILAAMRPEVQSSVRAVKMEVLRTTAEETLKNIFLDGYDVAKENMQGSCHQFMTYSLSHMVDAVHCTRS